MSSRGSSLELLNASSENQTRIIRDISEPDFRTNSELSDLSMKFLWANGRSLENILENEETDVLKMRARSERAEALVLDDEVELTPLSREEATRKGAIPKKFGSRSRVTVNPISEVVKRIPTSRTYFCLKSVLKNKQRRYTLVTPEEFQAMDPERSGGETSEFCRNRDVLPGGSAACRCSNCDNEGYVSERELTRVENSNESARVHCTLKSENTR